MSFPTMNAITVAKRFLAGSSDTTSAVLCSQIATGPNNFLSVPAVVDVSGMEYSFAVFADSISGAPGLAAGTASAASLALSDGGATGDNTTVAALATAITSTTAFVDTVPRDVTGTTATDLDADDWVNFHVTVATTTTAGVGQAEVALAFIYGKPGSIN